MASTKEVPNQIISGSAMSERDCFLMLIDSIGNARNCANGIAQLRKDIRWVAITKILDEMKDKVELLHKKPQGLIIPGRRFN